MIAIFRFYPARFLALKSSVFAVAIHAPFAFGSSLEPTTEAENFAAAAGVCRARVVSVEAFRHPVRGGIFTRVRFALLESIKGSFAKNFTIVQRGGVVGGEGESTGLGVDFRPGDEFLLHVGKRGDGTLAVLRGSDGATLLASKTKAVSSSASTKLTRLRQRIRSKVRSMPIGSSEDYSAVLGVTSIASSGAVSSSGLLVDANNIPSRFTAVDRGEPIGYLVDARTLPVGISLTAALQSVANALAAWSAQTTLTFRFDGLQDFGMSAADVTTADGRIRISLHDSFGEIPSSSTLGIGGRSYVYSGGLGATGGDGGMVDGLEFHKTTRGYVVLNHTAAFMQDPKFFEEVLCHEIGHALGMAHSSEIEAEDDAVLRDSIMYYLTHGDGRGASLGSYDIPIIQKIHPHDDTPPFSDSRVLTLVTTSTSPITAIPGVNEILLAAYDLQSPSSSLSIVTNGLAAGPVATSSFVGNLLRFTQTAGYGDGTIDPATDRFYYRKYVRFSDGANSSPWESIRVVATRFDSQGDGLPDSWSVEHFGSSTPSATALSRPNDDRDGDGFSNLQEFLMGTIPVSADSRLTVRSFNGQTIQWTASPYALYNLESSTNLSNWVPSGSPVVPTSSNASAQITFTPSPYAPKKFWRVRFGHAP